ncbi:MAG: hypothetical protein Q4D56_13430 [Bacteroides sp.]|nr:hypothetical protein [Bacteroides sp.]
MGKFINLNLSTEEREKYDYSLKILRDNYAVEQSAEERGRAEGRAEGKAEGRQEEKSKIALNMKHSGCDIALIMTCTGLSQEEIERLN